MVPRELLQELITHDIYILCLGDPGQLPPINSNDDNHLLDVPHIFLDEIMRQELDSNIIKLSMWVRENKLGKILMQIREEFKNDFNKETGRSD